MSQTDTKLEYQGYKIKIKPISDGYKLSVGGDAPTGMHINYNGIFNYISSMCFQTYPKPKGDDTGCFHLIMMNGPIRHDIQFLLKDVSKGEHKLLFEYFKQYLPS